MRNPQVVFEVLSPSTEQRDRPVKRECYMGIASLTAYVLVHSERMRVAVFLPGDDRVISRFYSVAGPDGSFDVPGLGPIELADLYRDATDISESAEGESGRSADRVG